MNRRPKRIRARVVVPQTREQWHALSQRIESLTGRLRYAMGERGPEGSGARPRRHWNRAVASLARRLRKAVALRDVFALQRQLRRGSP